MACGAAAATRGKGRGRLEGVVGHAAERVDPAAIRHTALLTVEGERDDICAIGQTLAAQ